MRNIPATSAIPATPPTTDKAMTSLWCLVTAPAGNEEVSDELGSLT